MRFLENGPCIPDDLLEQRDNGEVVFLCGAGTSIPSGLPSFVGLTKSVISDIGVPINAKSRALFDRALNETDAALAPPMDQVFNLLKDEYGHQAVELSVARALKVGKKVNTRPQEIILRLSADKSGASRLVTTNFDTLFEVMDSQILSYIPPFLPDIAAGQEFSGIVYLHGKLSKNRKEKVASSELILGSSDYGRAYLADGWATRFLRDLLRSFTVVLLGFSANDPPIRYLLQGLNHQKKATFPNLYAFDQGEVEEVSAKWRDRGVIGIAYPRLDESHSSLWSSLEKWADRAVDLERWQESLVSQALSGPRRLRPHERGQVVSLLRTAAGAKMFADQSPQPPPAEWICVFDRDCRFADLERMLEPSEVPPFDPLVAYGLDSDGPRLPKEKTNSIDLTSSFPFEASGYVAKRISHHYTRWSDSLPSRLKYMCKWFGKVAHEPAAIWWAAGQHPLHPELISQIEHSLESRSDQFSAAGKIAWEMLIHEHRHSPHDLDSSDWFEFLASVERRGWTTISQHEFEEVVLPSFRSKRPMLGRPCPPGSDWLDVRLSDLLNVEVVFVPLDGEKPKFPLESLSYVFRAARRGLEHAIGLMNFAGTHPWRTPTLHPEDRAGQPIIDAGGAYLLWTKSLFDELCMKDVRAASDELRSWPENEPIYFDKLRFYAWMKQEVISTKDVVAGVLKLSKEGLWHRNNRRELLHALRFRWREFSSTDRIAIENRLLAGPTKLSSKRDEERYRLGNIVRMLGWLENEGCKLSSRTIRRLQKLREKVPGWNPSWSKVADQSPNGRVGSVNVVSDPSPISNLKLSEILPVALKNSGPSNELTEFDPFRGLIERRPFRAISVLSYEARRGSFPIEFWRSLLDAWPDDTSARLNSLLVGRLMKFDSKVLLGLQHACTSWLLNNFARLVAENREAAWRLWDRLYCGIAEADSDDRVRNRGEWVEVERRKEQSTYEMATGSPISNLVHILLSDSVIGGGRSSSGLPKRVSIRLERSITAPREIKSHALSTICRNLNFLHRLDPLWTSKILLPSFRLEHLDAEAAWSGYLYCAQLPDFKLFALLKADFLGLFKEHKSWKWGANNVRLLHEFLIAAAHAGVRTKGRNYISFDQVRSALQKTSYLGREAALQSLLNRLKGPGPLKGFGIPFIDKAWPKELQYQTAETTHYFVRIALGSTLLFPKIVNAISLYIRPAKHLDMIIFNLLQQRRLCIEYPREVLFVLGQIIGHERKFAPLKLREVMEILANADSNIRRHVDWRRLDDLARQ